MGSKGPEVAADSVQRANFCHFESCVRFHNETDMEVLECPGNGNVAGEGSGAQGLRGAAEGPGVL